MWNGLTKGMNWGGNKYLIQALRIFSNISECFILISVIDQNPRQYRKFIKSMHYISFRFTQHTHLIHFKLKSKKEDRINIVISSLILFSFLSSDFLVSHSSFESNIGQPLTGLSRKELN